MNTLRFLNFEHKTIIYNEGFNLHKLRLMFVAAAVVLAATVQASTTIIKSDTTTMNTAADWGGIAPGLGNTGLFDNTITAGKESTLTLGGNVSLDSLVFSNNLNGSVTITDASTLTLGTSVGVVLTGVNQDVTLNCPSIVQAFSGIPSGRTITMGGGSTALFSANSSTGLGTVQLAAPTAKTFTCAGTGQPINVGSPSAKTGGFLIGSNCTVVSSSSMQIGNSGGGFASVNGGNINITASGFLISGRASGNVGRIVINSGAINVGSLAAVLIGDQNGVGEIDVWGGISM